MGKEVQCRKEEIYIYILRLNPIPGRDALLQITKCVALSLSFLAVSLSLSALNICSGGEGR